MTIEPNAVIPETNAVAAVPAVEDVTGRRVGAAVIDMVLLGLLFVVMSIAFGDSESSSGDGGTSFSANLSGAPFIVYLVLVYAYYTVTEAVLSQTLGKMAMGIKVVAIEGSFGWGKSFIRNILRLIDGLPVFYLVGFLTMVTSKQKQRIGDMAARTLVVRA